MGARERYAPAPPYGLHAVFAPWTDDERGVGTLDETTFLTVRRDGDVPRPHTLERSDGYRVTGDGPAFHRFGSRVLYARFDLDAWVKAKRPQRGRKRRVMAPGSNHDRGASTRAGAKPLERFYAIAFPLRHWPPT